MHIGWAFKCQLFHPSVQRPPRNTLHEIWNVKRWLLVPSPSKIICIHISIHLSWFNSALSRTTEWWKVSKDISCIHWKRSSLRHCWLTFRQIWTQTLKIGCNKHDAMHCKLYAVSWVFVSNSWWFFHDVYRGACTHKMGENACYWKSGLTWHCWTSYRAFCE